MIYNEIQSITLKFDFASYGLNFDSEQELNEWDSWEDKKFK